MIRVLIVDDHPIIRKGLRGELAEHSDISVVDEAADGNEAMIKARTNTPDVVLLDISLPGQSGLEVLKRLQDELPEVKVLMLSTYPEKQYAVRCLKGGAMGYVTKESASEELVVAIRKVADGRKYVSEQLADILADDVGAKKDMLPHEKLTAREFEILRLLGQGTTLTKIAEVLSLSVSTVSTHRSHILTKMQLQTTAQLIHYAIEHEIAKTLG